MIRLNAATQSVEVVEAGVGHNGVFESDAAKSAVDGGTAEVGNSAVAHQKVVGLAVGHAVAANPEGSVADPRVANVGPGAALHEDSAQNATPLAGDVAVKGFESVALKHCRFVVGSGPGGVDPEGSARSHPKARAAVKVNLRAGQNIKGGPAVHHRVAVDDVRLVVAPDFVGAQNHVGNEDVGVGFGLRNRQDAVGVVEVRVPGERHEVNVLGKAALFDAQGVLPKHFAVAAGRSGFDKNPDAVAGRNHHVFELGPRLAVGVEAKGGLGSAAQAQAAEVDVVGAGVDKADAPRGATDRGKHGVEVDGVLAAHEGHRFGRKPVLGPARREGEQGENECGGEWPEWLYQHGGCAGCKGRTGGAVLQFGIRARNLRFKKNSGQKYFVHLPSAKNGDRAKPRSKITKR